MSRSRRGPRFDQIDTAEQTRRRVGHQDLTAVAGGHHPRGAIQHRAEVVVVPQLGLAGRDPHSHRQLQFALRVDRRIDRRHRRCERRSHPVPGVAEHEALVGLDRRTQHLVVRGQCHPHRVRIGFPPTGRTLNIGEQKGHDP